MMLLYSNVKQFDRFSIITKNNLSFSALIHQSNTVPVSGKVTLWFDSCICCFTNSLNASIDPASTFAPNDQTYAESRDTCENNFNFETLA